MAVIKPLPRTYGLLEGWGDFYRVIRAMTRGFEGPPYSQAPDLGGFFCMLNTESIPLVIYNLFVREMNVVLPFSDCLKQKDRYLPIEEMDLACTFIFIISRNMPVPVKAIYIQTELVT